MGQIRDLGVIDLTPQPCGHVGPHEPQQDRYGETKFWLGYPANGLGEVCRHFVWSCKRYRQRGFTPVYRWRIECSCQPPWDWDDWSEAACLAMWASHVEVETGPSYGPEDAPLPWKDAAP